MTTTVYRLPRRRVTISNPLEVLIGYNLHRSARAMMLELSQRFRSLGLGTTTASILILIEANPGITQSELCELIGVQRANMTPLVRSLEQSKLIRKTARGRRRQALSMTREGATLCKQVRSIMDDIENIVFSTLDVVHRADFVDGIRKVGDQFASATKGRVAVKRRAHNVERR